MGKRSMIELSVTTALFVAVAGGSTIARGHLVGDLFILMLAPLLAAILTLAARSASRRAP
jgi:hypothetical protein